MRQRRPVKQEEIAQLLRSQIVEGRWRPGEQLPARAELVEALSISSVTLQRVMHSLREEGFLQTFGPQGTRVAAYPPHRHRFGLVLTETPNDPQLFGKICQNVIPEVLQNRENLEIKLFYGDRGNISSPYYKELETAVTTRAVAGLIILYNPSIYAGTPVLEQPGLPRVAMTLPLESPSHALPIVSFDRKRWMERTADEVVASGHRRVAVFGLLSNMQQQAHFDETMAILSSRGLICGPHWWQSGSIRHQHVARHIVQLMMRPEQASRPEAIIVEDDNLLAAILDGVQASGLRVPGDVQIFSHCNFPNQQTTTVPVRWIGMSVTTAMNQALDNLLAQSRGESVAKLTSLSPTLDGEICTTSYSKASFSFTLPNPLSQS